MRISVRHVRAAGRSWLLILWLVFLPVGWACDDLSPTGAGLAPSKDALLALLAKPKDPPTHLQHKVERRTTPVCERPFGLVVAPDNQTLFVACAGSGQVAALDTDHLELRWITSPLYDRLYKLVVDPRRERLYAVGMNGRLVHAIDRRDGTLIDQLQLDGLIADIALVPGYDRLVATTTQPPQAALVNLATFQIDGTVSFPTPPGSLAMRPDGQLAVASSGVWQVKDDQVAPVQEPVYLFDPHRPGLAPRDLGLGGTQARQALFVHDGLTLLVPERTANTVAVFDVASREHVRTIQVGAAPEKIVASPGGEWAFTMDSKGASITRLDLRRRAADGFVPLPGNPEDLLVSPDGLELYAALAGPDGNRGMVAVIDTRLVAVIGQVPVGLDPCCLALSHAGRKVFVSNFLSDTVSLLE